MTRCHVCRDGTDQPGTTGTCLPCTAALPAHIDRRTAELHDADDPCSLWDYD